MDNINIQMQNTSVSSDSRKTPDPHLERKQPVISNLYFRKEIRDEGSQPLKLERA